MAETSYQELTILSTITKDMKQCYVLLDEGKLSDIQKKAVDKFLRLCLSDIYDLHKHFDPLFGLQELLASVKKLKSWLVTFQDTEKVYKPSMLMPFTLYTGDTDRIIVVPKD